MPYLKQTHLEELRKSGLTDQTIEAAGIYTMMPEEALEKLNKKYEDDCLAYPYHHSVGYYRVKPDKSIHEGKYDQKAGEPPRLYFPPDMNYKTMNYGNIHIPLIITEEEKKSLKLWQEL